MIAVSVGRNFEDPDVAKAILSTHDGPFIFVQNNILREVCQENELDFEEVKINWKNFRPGDPKKEGKFGPYNPNAPKNAASIVVEKCDGYIKIAEGDYSVNMAAKEKGLALKGSSAESKSNFIYKF